MSNHDVVARSHSARNLLSLALAVMGLLALGSIFNRSPNPVQAKTPAGTKPLTANAAPLQDSPTITSTKLVLYDAATPTLPPAQGLNYLTSPLTPPQLKATQTFENGATILDTTLQQSDKAGYTNFFRPTSQPTLDRNLGYRLKFNLQMLAEAHNGTNGPNRAGFSVIIISQDLKAIELGFWPDRVWAQEAGFTKAEEVLLDTTAATDYELTVLGDNYRLKAGSKLLSGSLRQYSLPQGDPFKFVYETPNLMFLGDDTGSAQAKIAFRYASITTNLTQVTSAADSPTPADFPITLRQALANAGDFPGSRVTFNLPTNPTPPIVLATALPIPAQVKVEADCANPIKLRAGFAQPIELGGQNNLRGLEIEASDGPILKVKTPGLDNRLECTRLILPDPFFRRLLRSKGLHYLAS